MERRFKKDSRLKELYTRFMSEYEDLGHMSKINEHLTENENVFYLPHHGVLKEASDTTKLRVVFDGSCKSSNGLCLNDVTLVGPTVQDELFSILMRFRKHHYVIIADIEKMYRQVWIAEDQRHMQRIVWRSDENQPVQHYTLNTVTYGVSSSAFMAIRALQQAGMDHQHTHPLSSQIILKDFYVDDLISGANNIIEARQLRKELCTILSKYGFHLRKWISNDKRILENESENNALYHIAEDEGKKTLGVYWQSAEDTFKFIINQDDLSIKIFTKRNLLAAISKVFDPLGLIAPIVIQSKIFMQSLWQLHIDWDEQLPSNLVNEWQEFYDQLRFLSNISIPRQVILDHHCRIELHVFSDASLKAYGASIYIKSFCKDETKVSLLCSKTRVSPIKTITLPRLELCAAVLGVKLHAKVVESLLLNIDQSYFWTDSTIVLSWISLPANSLKIFVSNRVSVIQQYTKPTQWHHVPSNENPADLLSRGVNSKILVDNSLWWNGPIWLHYSPNNWPQLTNHITEIPERKSTQVALLNVTMEIDIFSRYSSFTKLLKVVAWIFRFFNNSRNKATKRIKGDISAAELHTTTIRLLQLCQSESFSRELSSLKSDGSVHKKSKLISLDPAIGEDNLIRVGGRLENSKLNYNRKHQIILDPNHPLTRLIIVHEHKRQLHAGAQTLLNSLRERYWILRGRLSIRSAIRKCLICFKSNPTRLVQKMANLPEDRVVQNRPFIISGVDFAGPFYIKDGKLRNRKIIKSYLCLFICFTTKAVHLETVGDLSTDAFLNALKRFVSRRGICKLLYSDNGSNLVGANNSLKAVYDTIQSYIFESNVRNFLLENRIEWKFIPPRSPHHGGLWESAIKRAKFHLTRIIGNCHLTFEQLSTIFCQVESIMNSRPLTPLSDDSDDFQALTPGHFLIGDVLTSVPENDLSNIPDNRLNQYQFLQKLCQQFWKRWSTDYLSSLQQRSKWHDATPSSTKVGSLVILVDDNQPPLYWRMGRITELHPGSDGLVRVCTIKTSSGSTKRAVQKLCLLPVNDVEMQ